MIIQTKYHGEIEIDEANIIHFEQGIPSFIDEKQFYILPLSEVTPLLIMQSIQTAGLAFVIISPFDFFTEYSAKLSDQTIEQLKIEKEEDVALYSILTIQEPFEKTTANLQGPIVVNTKEKLAKQIVINDPNYNTKHNLFNIKSSVGQEG